MCLHPAEWCHRPALLHQSLKDMTKKEKMLLRVLLPLVVVAIGIFLWKRGYAFGQWLHAVLN